MMRNGTPKPPECLFLHGIYTQTSKAICTEETALALWLSDETLKSYQPPLHNRMGKGGDIQMRARRLLCSEKPASLMWC